MARPANFSVKPPDLNDAASKVTDAAKQWNTINHRIDTADVDLFVWGLLGLAWHIPELYATIRTRMEGYSAGASTSLHTCATRLKQAAGHYNAADQKLAAQINSVKS